MKRNLVKLDGEIIEIEQNDEGKLVAKKLTDEELVHVHVLEGSVSKMLDNEFNKIANETLDEVRKEFKTNLRNTLLNIVGFSNSWGRWEIDHCNGRMSELTNYMSDKVKQDFRDSFSALMKEDIEKMVVPMREQLTKEYQEVFTRTVRSDMREHATKAAKQFLTDILSKEISKIQQEALKKAEVSFLTKNNLDADKCGL